MKRNTKITLGALALGILTVGLTSCTASFCSVADKSQVMYAYDVYNVLDKDGNDTGRYSFGVSTYYDADDQSKPEDAVLLDGYGQLYVDYNIESNLALVEINKNAEKNNVFVGDYLQFWSFFDNEFLDESLKAAGYTDEDKETITYDQVREVLIGNKEGSKKGYGYIKYSGSNEKGTESYWVNWNDKYQEARYKLGVDNCPNYDYVKFFQSSMTRYASTANSCIATTNGFYGYYGFNNDNKIEVFIEAKDWGYAWNKGFLEGLLVYPIGWLIDATTNQIYSGVGPGWAQMLSIFLITFLVRAVMMLLTINQTLSSAKMTELQPEIAKIQEKYPNANQNSSERNALAMETQALYKKNKVHPFLSILVMFIQFPVFICVWGAMTGSAILASDEFLGLRLSESVSSMLFNINGWPNNPGWWTALVLFLIMAALQVVSMLLPQYINKRKQKSIAKTKVNNAANKQNNMMKWFTIIMMVMIIFMGFSLASGMVIYWIAGSIWTIAQTLIIELVHYLKKKNKNKPRKPKAMSNGNTVVDAEVIPEQFAAPTGKKKYKKGSND